ncbi:hypothetical protein [Microbacterium hydrocarbonoxydans]|uniref:hypothetical protein n=1 Tax=Microbacterium hydrocarbonoxydans TaxID=273678 RepID=UPI00203A6457|nr:hypothetical protein [Microbacterium hydrocarbonoxydans]MCM3779861.1 hypothetical protein [Microbacterium hydrocarbonoxydans]
MGATITHSAGEIIPTSMPNWAETSEARTIMHPILGREDDDVTFRPFGMRRGTFIFVFADGAAAHAARAVLRTAQKFGLEHSEIPEIAMTFVVADGDIGIELGAAGDWKLTIPFREVKP